MMMFIRLLRIFDFLWCSYDFMLMFLWFPIISSCCHDCLMICVWCLMIFLLLLWSSYDCLWFPYDVLTIFLWCSYEFLMVFLRFPMFVVWFLDMFSWFPMICVSPCPMICVCFPMNYYDCFMNFFEYRIFLGILVIGIVVVVIIYSRSNRNNNNNCN